jgi:hypothetical protein
MIHRYGLVELDISAALVELEHNRERAAKLAALYATQVRDRDGTS